MLEGGRQDRKFRMHKTEYKNYLSRMKERSARVAEAFCFVVKSSE